MHLGRAISRCNMDTSGKKQKAGGVVRVIRVIRVIRAADDVSFHPRGRPGEQVRFMNKLWFELPLAGGWLHRFLE